MENKAKSFLYLQRKHCQVSYIASRDVAWVATMVGPPQVHHLIKICLLLVLKT